MSEHYQRVVRAKEGDFLPIAEALVFYQAAVIDGLRDLVPEGKIFDFSKSLPGLMAYRYTQLQEVEAILDHMTLQANRKHAEHKRRFLEQHTRSLSEKAASDYASIENDVYNLRVVINEITMVRNKLAGLSKGLEALHFQIGHLVKMRIAGMEDATF